MLHLSSKRRLQTGFTLSQHMLPTQLLWVQTMSATNAPCLVQEYAAMSATGSNFHPLSVKLRGAGECTQGYMNKDDSTIYALTSPWHQLNARQQICHRTYCSLRVIGGKFCWNVHTTHSARRALVTAYTTHQRHSRL